MCLRRPPESSGLILLAAQRVVCEVSLADVDAGPWYGDESLAAALRAAAGAEQPAELVGVTVEGGVPGGRGGRSEVISGDAPNLKVRLGPEQPLRHLENTSIDTWPTDCVRMSHDCDRAIVPYRALIARPFSTYATPYQLTFTGSSLNLPVSPVGGALSATDQPAGPPGDGGVPHARRRKRHVRGAVPRRAHVGDAAERRPDRKRQVCELQTLCGNHLRGA